MRRVSGLRGPRDGMLFPRALGDNATRGPVEASARLSRLRDVRRREGFLHACVCSLARPRRKPMIPGKGERLLDSVKLSFSFHTFPLFSRKLPPPTTSRRISLGSRFEVRRSANRLVTSTSNEVRTLSDFHSARVARFT